MSTGNSSKGGGVIWLYALSCFVIGALCFHWSRTSGSEIEQTIKATVEKIERAERISPQERAAEIHLILWELAQRLESKNYYLGLVEHVSLALIVAGFLLVTVELNTKRQLRREVNQYRKEVAANVWRAVSGRLLGEGPLREIDSILKSNAVRKDARSVIRLKAPYAGVPQGYMVVRREGYYRVHNLSGVEGFPYTIRIVTDSRFPNQKVAINGKEERLPRFECLKVNGKKIDLQTAITKGNERTLEYLTHLPASSSKFFEVYSCSEEMCELSDGYRSTMLTLTEGLTLTVVNEAPAMLSVRTVRLHHPNWKDFSETVPGTWVFSGTVLPGQGFTVWWEETRKTAEKA